MQQQPDFAVYGADFGKNLLVCPNYPACDSYALLHPDGSLASLPADRPTRLARSRAHNYFDLLWKRRWMHRVHAYILLQQKMCLPRDAAHIGFFSIEQCETVVEITKNYMQYLVMLQPDVTIPTPAGRVPAEVIGVASRVRYQVFAGGRVLPMYFNRLAPRKDYEFN